MIPARAAAAIFLAALLLSGGAVAADEEKKDPGVRVGYFKGADADQAVATAGLYTRFNLPGPVDLELSVDLRKEELADGDLEAQVVPVQASALFSPFKDALVKPYLLGGVGFHYARLRAKKIGVDLQNKENRLLGLHAGGGLEIGLGSFAALSADVRYFAVEEASGEIEAIGGRRYRPGGWMATAGIGIFF